MEPLASFVSSVFLWPVRFHFRLQAHINAAEQTMRHGRAADMSQVLSQASQQSCQTLKQLFRQQMGQKSCPETLLIRSAQMRVSILPSRFGRRTVLMATDTLVSQLSDSELRFLLGREMGRAWLHHSELLSPWILQHFLRDVILFPLHVIGLQPKEPPMPKRSFKQWMLLRRWVDGIANACDVYRGGLSALGTAAVGSAVPRLAALVFSLSAREERQLKRALRLGTWGVGLWAAKSRAEIFSFDRVGFLAAGDLDAATRAMIMAANAPQDVAMASLLGTEELVKQAEYLTSVLPVSYWSRQPSLHARVADLNSWVHSPLARAALREV
ncbi:unnamed protein product [Durusdinium trenchii]|uniref:Ste24 endopeptidase n=1 Tax=Durusdinium trenchii TaxID=1381693 RepID=A0ABP0QFR3_9DINO